jgi:hypothetical protein
MNLIWVVGPSRCEFSGSRLTLPCQSDTSHCPYAGGELPRLLLCLGWIWLHCVQQAVDSVGWNYRTGGCRLDIPLTRFLEALISKHNAWKGQTCRSPGLCTSALHSCNSLHFLWGMAVTWYKSIILPVVLYGCETWSLTSREEHYYYYYWWGGTESLGIS